MSLIAPVAGYAAGSIPFSNLASRALRGVDLREHGSGTVSGTALYEVAGFVPLAVAGVLDVGKGAVGPVLAGRDAPGRVALGGAAAVVAHNWSPLLGGAGGRGISPALGALLVSAPAGAALLLGGLAAGRVVRQTALVAGVAELALVPFVARVHGRTAALAAAAIVAPMLVKRVTGNAPLPIDGRRRVAWERFLFDRDPQP